MQFCNRASQLTAAVTLSSSKFLSNNFSHARVRNSWHHLGTNKRVCEIGTAPLSFVVSNWQRRAQQGCGHWRVSTFVRDIVRSTTPIISNSYLLVSHADANSC